MGRRNIKSAAALALALVLLFIPARAAFADEIAGANIEEPPIAVRGETSITVSGATLDGDNVGEQTIEYYCSTSDSAQEGGAWQDDTTFEGLDPETTYYVWARSKANGDYLAGEPAVSAPIPPKEPPVIETPSPSPAPSPVPSTAPTPKPTPAPTPAPAATTAAPAPDPTPLATPERTTPSEAVTPTESKETPAATPTPSPTPTAAPVTTETPAATLAQGAAVDKPPIEYSKTDAQIIVIPAELGENAGGQTIEYFCSRDGENPPADGEIWQEENTFKNLEPETTYYVWARSKAKDGYLAGAPRASGPITTEKTPESDQEEEGMGAAPAPGLSDGYDTPAETEPPATPTPSPAPAEAPKKGGGGVNLAVGVAVVVVVLSVGIGAFVLLKRGRGGGVKVSAASFDGIRVANIQGVGSRKSQQDSFAVSDVTDAGKGLLAIVADGIGGGASGDVISKITVDKAISEFNRAAIGSSLGDILVKAYSKANREAVEYLNGDIGGSTAVAVIVRDYELWFASVGDSRICILRNGSLIQLNREHTKGAYLDEMAARGEISFLEAKNDPKRAAVTSFIGVGEDMKIDRNIAPIPLLGGDRIIVMSDGIFGTVPEDELIAAASIPDVYAAGAALENAVRSKNKPHQDNYTAVILAF